MSNTYTYPFSTYFSNGVSINLLETQLTASLPFSSLSINNGQITFNFTTTIIESNLISIFLTHVPSQSPFLLCYINNNYTSANLQQYMSTYGTISINIDTYCILFFDVIPTVSTINTAIKNYVEPPANIPVTLNTNSSQNYINSSIGQIIISKQPMEIIVSVSGNGQYVSLVDAVNSINNIAAIIKLYPGTYYENNPIAIPANCCIIGQGTAGNTIIIGINNTSAVLEVGVLNKITDVTIVGGSIGVQHNGSNISTFSLLENCFIQNSGIAISISGGLGSLILIQISIVGSNSQNAIIINNGSLIGSNIIIEGSPTSFMGTGLILQNNSLTTVNNFSIYYCNLGINIFDGSTIKSTLINIDGCGVGCQISSDTPGTWNSSRLMAGVLNIDNSLTYDLVINNMCTIQLLSVHLDETKINNTTNTIINGNIQNYRNNHNYQVLSGKILAGTEQMNSSLYIGPNVNSNNVIVFIETSGIYTDISTLVRTRADPPQSIVNGQNIYIAYTGKNTYYNICRGFDILVTNTSTSPITPQYWNGTVWVNINYSIYDIKNEMINNNTTILSQSCSVYLDQTYTPIQNTINGIGAYWVCLYNLPNCSINNITYHSNITRYDVNGYCRLFANCRKQRSIYLLSNLVSSINGLITFINPCDMDISTPYTISISANAGMIINSTTFNTTFGQIINYATSNTQIQQFNVNASNVSCISITYYSIS